MNKPVTGLYIGRFQPLTLGHVRVIDTMLYECENLIIVIGSTQEMGTERNPFNFSTRKQMIKNVYTPKPFEVVNKWEKIKVIGLCDIFNPSAWAKYVLDDIDLKIEEGEIKFPKPDTYYCGSYLDGHFFQNTGLNIRVIDRTDIKFPLVTSSMVRQMCRYQDKRWKEYVPEQIWEDVQYLVDKYNKFSGI